MSNIAELAGRLSKAQREAMRGDYSDSHLHIASITTAACRCALQRLGLVIDRQYAEGLTPLGQQVRAHLLTQEPRK